MTTPRTASLAAGEHRGPLTATLTVMALAALSFSLLATSCAEAAVPTEVAPTTVAAGLPGLPDFSRITQQYGAAVVNISVSGMRQVSAGSDNAVSASADADPGDGDPAQLFLRRFQQQFGGTGATMQVPVHALGSGFTVSPDGLILTSAHVVANASEVVGINSQIYSHSGGFQGLSFAIPIDLVQRGADKLFVPIRLG